MSFWSTGAAHSYAERDMVVNRDGLRGIVADASALYVLIRWEDGREEEVEQGEPSVTAVAEEGAWNVRTGEWMRDTHEESKVEISFDLWHTAGPKPNELPETPVIEALEAAA
jgi:hypothetical protein